MDGFLPAVTFETSGNIHWKSIYICAIRRKNNSERKSFQFLLAIRSTYMYFYRCKPICTENTEFIKKKETCLYM